MLLSLQERKEIELTIAKIEQQTSSEIVVAVVGQSNEYAEFKALLTAFWSLAITLTLHTFFPHWSATTLLLLQIPIALVLWPLCSLKSVLRSLIPTKILERAAFQRALQLFSEYSVYKTREHSGLLIMLSELEHQVVILADSGLDALIKTEGWKEFVQTIISGIRQKHTAKAILGVLERLRPLLAAKFPPTMENPNELSNTVTYLHR